VLALDRARSNSLTYRILDGNDAAIIIVRRTSTASKARTRASCPRRPTSHVGTPPLPAIVRGTQIPIVCGTARSESRAVSSLAAFRTPAPVRGERPSWGRRPKSLTSTEMLRLSISRLLFLAIADAPRRPERRVGLVEPVGLPAGLSRAAARRSLCVQRHSSRPVLFIPLWRGTQIGLRLPSHGPPPSKGIGSARASDAKVGPRSVGASTNT
jgi:hypothetical protein